MICKSWFFNDAFARATGKLNGRTRGTEFAIKVFKNVITGSTGNNRKQERGYKWMAHQKRPPECRGKLARWLVQPNSATAAYRQQLVSVWGEIRNNDDNWKEDHIDSQHTNVNQLMAYCRCVGCRRLDLLFP